MNTLRMLGWLLAAATGFAASPVSAEPGDAAKDQDPKLLYTNVYTVPPGFLQEADPETGKRPTAKEFLEGQDVEFLEGASAVHNPGGNRLIVRNTGAQTKRVESIVEKLMKAYSTRIKIVYLVIETEESLFPKADETQESKGPASKVLTEEEASTLFEQIEGEEKRRIKHLQPMLVRTGQQVQMWFGDLLAQVDPVLAAGDKRIDLNLGFLVKTASGPASARPVIPVSIQSGQTVAVEQKREPGKFQTALVTASVVDVRGQPAEEKEGAKSEKTAESTPVEPKEEKRELTSEEKESVRTADEVALRGAQKLADRDYEAGAKDFQVAVDKLPDHPLVEQRRKAYTTQLKNSLRRIEESKRPTRKETAGTEKLKNIIIPAINFRNTSLEKALGFLEGRSIELDRDSPESNRGVRLILAKGEFVGGTEITLQLSNVPLGEALRYTLKLANCKSEVEGRTVTVSPMTQADQKEILYTNTYIVPPSFLTLPNATPKEKPKDPFAAPSRILSPRPTAKEVLENYGIVFGEGSSATYNPGSSTLIVRQTQDQMDLVEAVVQSLTKPAEKQIIVDFRILETKAPLFPGTKKRSKPPKNPYDPDSGARIVSQPGNLYLGRNGVAPPSIISKVFTPNQTVDLLRGFENGKAGTIRKAPPVIVRSGQRVEMWIRDQVAQLDPVLGPDDLTIDLNLTLMTGKPGHGAGRAPATQITIWDGQTIAIEQHRGKDRYRTALFTARIVDPAGMPIHKEKPAAEKTGKAKPTQKPKGPTRNLTREEQDSVQLADEAALRGSQLIQDVEFEQAAKEFHTAVKSLPDHPIVSERRDAYTAQLWKALLYAEDPEMTPPPSAEVMERKEREAANAEPVKRRIYFNAKEVIVEKPEGDLFGFLLGDRGKEFFDPSKSPTKGRPHFGVAGVFTDPQFQMMIRAITQRKGPEVVSGPGILAEPDKPTIARINERRVGIIGNVGTAGYKIDLKLYIPESGEPVFGKRGDDHAPTASLTIWDGQTVAYAEPIEKDSEKIRLTFVSAKVIDPTGISVELPEKATSEPADVDAALLFPPESTERAFSDFVLKADEKLIIHEAKTGDTLFQLAKTHGTSVNRIKEVSRLRNNNLIFVDEPVLIPVKIREHFLKQVEAGWEPQVSKDGVLEKVRSIILPSIEFVDTPLADAFDFLKLKSVELDRESPEGERGFDFILKNREAIGDAEITLKLSNVPLHDAIRYTSKLANCDYEIEGRTVTISSKSEGGSAGQKRKVSAENSKGIDPADVWFAAFSKLQEGEAYKKAGKELHARAAFAEAEQLFGGLAREFPTFYPDVVKFRVEQLKEMRTEKKGEAAAEPGEVSAKDSGFALKEGEWFVIHTVEKGDSLWTVAQRHKTRISRIQAANALKGDVLKVGQELRIPVKETPPAKTKPPSSAAKGPDPVESPTQ